MAGIEKDLQITVHADISYMYEVSIADSISLKYIENKGNNSDITFGSVEEMQEVANAMLALCKFHNELK